jgi:hypothetical protein
MDVCVTMCVCVCGLERAHVPIRNRTKENETFPQPFPPTTRRAGKALPSNWLSGVSRAAFGQWRGRAGYTPYTSRVTLPRCDCVNKTKIVTTNFDFMLFIIFSFVCALLSSSE